MDRTVQRLSKDFRFRQFPLNAAYLDFCGKEYDDGDWESVRVPHDWAANGLFAADNDASCMSIVQDGIVKPIVHTGRTGALPTIGCGIYRKWLDIAADAAGKEIFLEFDGVMWEARIFINGREVFFNHFGYKSFCVDITDYVIPGERNLLAVAAFVYPDCSRWYPGAGIYRNVRLIMKNKAHIAYNGIWVRQLEVTDELASFLLCVDYEGTDQADLKAKILDPDGNLAAEVSAAGKTGHAEQVFVLSKPVRWDMDAPRMYTAVVQLCDEEGNVLDGTEASFGIRTIRFCADEGFFLNGRHVRINGVCMHHDLGSLGAALNKAALRRQLEKLMEMGVNAIRTSHNPPAPELLDLCDEMGLLVIDEFFDEWKSPKISNGYSKYFDDFAVSDIRDIMRRDRNHPSVVMWSIGNEIMEQGQTDGWRVAKLLADATRSNDPTRPVTAGLNSPVEAFKNHMPDFLDVVGLNYKPHLYATFHEDHPDKPMLGAETASCVSTRGVYKLPAQIDRPVQPQEDLTVSAFELCAPNWAMHPEIEWESQDDNAGIAGEFVWTGFDYLGEPTPYYGQWPSRSSYFGIFDMAGLPKNRYYGYKSRWTKEPVLHVFPHWNWEGMEGQGVPVHVYTNYPKVELFLNGKTQGVQCFSQENELTRYRMIWEDVCYEPGTLLAVAYDENGAEAMRAEVKTAGKPAAVRLLAERSAICADGEDLVYVIASVVDENGTVCPHADNRLIFEVSGAGELLTTDAGDQRETESFARADKKALAGYLVGCVRSLEEPGKVRIRVRGDGLQAAEVTVDAI